MTKAAIKRGSANHLSKSYQRSASSSGFHFFNLYQNCPRKFLLRFVQRLQPKIVDVALLSGTAFHEGKATWYRTGDIGKAVQDVRDCLEAWRADFQDEETYIKYMFKTPVLLTKWIEAQGIRDLEDYRVVAIEKDYSVQLPESEHRFTCRIDALLEDKRTKDLYIFETKTSGSSISTASKGVFYGDQITGQAWAVTETEKRTLAGIVPDIAYWHKTSTSEANIQFWRQDVVLRSKIDMDEFAQGTAFLSEEISARVQAVRDDVENVPKLFPRNTYYCTAYFRNCEFCDWCRDQRLWARKPFVPSQFARKSHLKGTDLASYVLDTHSEPL